MSIGIGLHCWWCDRGPCNGTCYEQNTKPIKKSMSKIKKKVTKKPETYDQRMKRIREDIKKGKVKKRDSDWIFKMAEDIACIMEQANKNIDHTTNVWD